MEPSPPQLDDILAAALEWTDAEERRRYLEQACAGRDALRAEVESLLAAHAAAGGFMQTGAMARPDLPPAVPGEQPGARIGHYRLLEPIGEGGFGVVWMADQEAPVRRRVALKIIKVGMDTREVVARFEAERKALALMDHPHIARVFDGGATDSGRPYFVMELVRGVPITEYCDASQLNPAARLELFLQVCQAVQHAHQKGVIHRDLKPTNVLVTELDGRAVPKVIDFGVAKATAARLTEKTLFTRFNQWIGTPAYMSPEQAGLASLDEDTRSDVYALGVLLYELLTGRTPFDTKRLLEAGYEAVMRTIREVEPAKPSTRLSTLSDLELGAIARQRGAEPAKLHRLVRGELDWIVMKALEKDRARRYETAAALATDVQHYLRQEPVSAAAPTLTYQLSKFVRRNRPLLTAATICAFAILAGAGFSVWQAFRATRAAAEAERGRNQADTQSAIATAVRDFLERDLLAQATPLEGGEPKPEPDLNVRTLLDRASAKIDGKFPRQALVEASLRATMANAYHDLGAYQTGLVHALRAAELSTRELGPTNARTLEARVEVGDAYRHLRQWPEAIREFRELGALQERLHGPAHSNTLGSLRLLGLTLAEAGQIEAGQAVLKDALRRNESAGSDGPARARELTRNLASTYSLEGRLDRAEELYRQNLQLARTQIQPPTRETLVSLYLLGTTLHSARKLPEAEALYRETLALADRLLHPGEDDGTLLANLAAVLAAEGRFDEAQSDYERALALRRAAAPRESPALASMLVQYASFLARHERFTEAEPLLREALRIVDRPDAATRVDPFLPRILLAAALQSSGRPDEAARLVGEMESRLQPPRETTRETLRAWAFLSSLLRLQGRLAEGEALLGNHWEAAAWAVFEERDPLTETDPKPLAPEVALARLNSLIASPAATNSDGALAYWARGAQRGRRGQSAGAAADFSRSFELSSEFLCLPLIALHLDAGDAADLDRQRARLWARYQRAPGRVSSKPIEYVPGLGWQPRTNVQGEPLTAAAVAFSLALPDARVPDAHAAELAAFAVEHGTGHPDRGRFQLTLALSDYRRDRPDAAANGCRQCLSATPLAPALRAMAHAVLSLAERRLGHSAAADHARQAAGELVRDRLAIAPGRELDLGPDWPDWIAARVLFQEATHPLATRSPPARIAATVDGDVIFEQEVQDRMAVEAGKLSQLLLPPPTNGLPAPSTPEYRRRLAGLRERTLQELIERTLIVQDFDRQGFQVRPEQLDDAVHQRIETYYEADTNVFQRTLAAKGMSEAAFRSLVEKDIACACLIRQRLEDVRDTSRTELETYYRQHADQFTEPEAFDLTVLAITKTSTDSTATVEETRRAIEALRERIIAGADLAGAATNRADLPQPRSGGHLGWVQREHLKPELIRAVTALKSGELTPVIETESHFFLVRLRDHRASATKPLAAVEERIRSQLDQEHKAAARERWLTGLRQQARIEITPPPADSLGENP